jgi:DNA-directed RNA polymerase specialized sigma24 family protein
VELWYLWTTIQRRGMPPAPRTTITSETLLTAILALLIAEREERNADPGAPRKTEVILRAAGLGVSDIASVMGKKPNTVKMTLQRAQ